MKEVMLLERNPEQRRYAEDMAALLSAIPRDRPTRTTVQCASTQAILDRDPACDEEWFNRPWPESVIAQSRALRDAKSDEERARLVNQIALDPVQVQVLEAHRRQSKNTLGQSELSGITEDAKRLAIDAFIHSPPAKLTPSERKKVTELMPMSSRMVPPEEEDIEPEAPLILHYWREISIVTLLSVLFGAIAFHFYQLNEDKKNGFRDTIPFGSSIKP